MNKKIIFILLTAITLFYCDFAEANTQSMSIKQGFNFISFTCKPDLSPQQIINQNTAIAEIYSYSAASGSFLSAGEGTLTSLNIGRGYIVKSSNDIVLNITGTDQAQVGAINLKTGFNLIGFSKFLNDKKFSSLLTNFQMVKGIYKWSAASGSFIQVIRNNAGIPEQMDGIDPACTVGQSYFFNLGSDTTLNYDDGNIIFTGSSQPQLQATTPQISPNSGTYSTFQSAVITSSTPDATIKYTMDGSLPSSSNGTIYTGTIEISTTCTLKAIVLKQGMTDSAISSVAFIINIAQKKVENPLISPNSGTFVSTQQVSITCATSDAMIKYTMDGSTPSLSNGITYSSVIIISSTITIKAIAIKLNMVDSDIISAKYVKEINIQPSVNDILVTGGTFTMGDTFISYEKPTHQVTLSNYFIEKYEVTNSEYCMFLNSYGISSDGRLNYTQLIDFEYSPQIKYNSGQFIVNSGKENYPVNFITWYGAAAYCNWLSQTKGYPKCYTESGNWDCDFTKQGYRLPTEAEWEYAARGGNQSRGYKYSGSNTLDDVAWYWINSINPNNNLLSTGHGSFTVGGKTANELGIFDMAGNVAEWCNDWYDSYSSNAMTNPTGPSTATYRAARGGDWWNSNVDFCRSTARGAGDPAIGSFNFGFRPARSASYTSMQQVETPILSPTDGTSFLTSRQVSISCATLGATIKYTTDNSTPSLTNGTTYSSAITLSSSTTIKVIAIKSDMTDSVVAIATYTKMGDLLANPTFTPVNGTVFSTSQQVSIECATGGASIYYTTDGSTPTISSTKYISSFTITATTTIKAIAVKTGYTNSNITNVTYSKMEKVANPTFTPTNGATFLTSQQVSITCATAGTTIYYTTNGTQPTTSSTKYIAPFIITATTTIQAIAAKTGYTNSDITNVTYSKMEKVANPTFIPTNGTVFSTSQQVSISCITADAAIYYTTNGTLPTISSTKYIAPFTITATTTIQAVAVKTDMANSEVLSSKLTNVSDLFDYADNGISITITKCKVFTGEVIVPDTIKDKPVTSIGNSAFSGCRLTNVTISNNVASIGTSAFLSCVNLKSIIIPNNVTFISNNAFSDCTSLTSITLPNSVTNIGNGAFSGCTSLTSITIPNSVTSVGTGVLSGCTSLTSITIPNSVTSVGTSAFSGCTSLKSITIPNSVTSIGTSAFSGCGLTSITIPNSVISIGTSAFLGCTGLMSVTISNGVKTIGDNAFSGCTSLKNITIPDSVTTIGTGVFYHCTGLTNFTIPNGVTNIGDNIFSGCTSLTSVTIPNNITSIGNDSFSWCGLTSVNIPDSVKVIGNSAFKNCTSLTNITIPNSVTIIFGNAFSSCTSLTNITIPNSVTTIYNNVFSGCASLRDVAISNNITSIETSVFSGCTSLTNITIPSSITTIKDKAFLDCSNLKSIIVPNSVTNIGNNTFEGCTSLTNIAIPSSVTTIGSSVFQRCTGLISVTLPSNIKEISINAFQNCNSLTSITIPSGVTGIGSGAFRNCNNLTSITMPDGILNIGIGVFTGCTGLTSITIPNGVTSIGASAFEDCINLSSVIIPNSVTIFGASAFRNCTGLTSFTISSSVTSIGSGAFSGCTGLTSIKIPNGSAYVGDESFSGCARLTSAYFYGNAPTLNKIFYNCPTDLKIYYIYGKTGWASTWNGYVTATFVPGQ